MWRATGFARRYWLSPNSANAWPGVVTGLAWTDVGGELLTIEAAMMPGKGRMTVTGNLRDVMKESISAAASYVRSRAVAFGIELRRGGWATGVVYLSAYCFAEPSGG